MSDKLGPVDIEFVLKNVNFKKEGDRIKAEIRGISDTAKREVDETNKLLRSLGTGLLTYFTFQGAKGFTQELINVRGEFQQMGIAMETILGSKQKADALMAQVVDLAAKTPFTLTEVGQGAKQLLAFQESNETVIDTLTRLGNIASGISVPIGRLITVYGQVKAKGRLMGDDLRQFTEAGIPLIHELAKQFGVADTEIAKMVETGKIGFSDVQKVIMNLTNEGGMFFNLMEKQSKSLTGMVSNLQDAWDKMLNEIGKGNEGLLAGGIKGLTALVNNYQQVIDVLKALITTYGTYKAASVVTYIAEQSLAAGSLTKALKNLFLVQQAINVAGKMNPFGLAIGGIAALISGLSLYRKYAKDTVTVTDEINKSISSEVFKLNDLFTSIKKAGDGTDDRNRLINIANERYSTYLPNLLTEKSTLLDIEDAQKRVTQALAADLAVRKSRDEINKLLGESDDKFKKGFEDFTSSYAKILGADRLPEMLTDLKETIDRVVLETNGEVEKYRISVSNRAAEFYNEWIQVLTTKSDDAKLAFGNFLDAFLDVSEFEGKQKQPLEVLQAYIDSFSKMLLKKPKKPSGSVDPNSGITDPIQLLKNQIQEAKELYEEFESYQKVSGDFDVSGLYNELLAKGKNYKEYLQNLFDTLGEGKLKAIVAVEMTGIKGKDESISEYEKYLKELLQLTQTYDQKRAAIDISYQMDMDALQKEGATENMRVRTELYKKDIEELEANNFKKSESYRWVYDNLENMGRKALQEYIARLKREIEAFKGNEEIKLELTKKLAEAEEKLAIYTPKKLREAATVLNEMAEFAGTFNQELAESINQVANLATGIASAVEGFSTGNYAQGMAGSIQAVTSLIKLLSASERQKKKDQEATEKLSKWLDQMAASLDRLNNAFQSLKGDDKIKAYNILLAETAESLVEVDKKLRRYFQDFQNMSKVKFPSVKGMEDIAAKTYERLTATDWERIIASSSGSMKKSMVELYNEWLKLKAQQEEYFKEQAEYITGTSFDGLVDEMVGALQDGERSVKDFADNAEALIKKAVIQGFKTKYLTQALEPWYKEFAKLGENGYTAEEIAQLKDAISKIMGDAGAAFDALGTLGIDLTGASDNANSLAGSISGITEETASILAGRLNSMHLTINEGLRVAQRGLLYQAEIAGNTARLYAIETSLKSIINTLAGDTSQITTARGKGIK